MEVRLLITITLLFNTLIYANDNIPLFDNDERTFYSPKLPKIKNFDKEVLNVCGVWGSDVSEESFITLFNDNPTEFLKIKSSLNNQLRGKSFYSNKKFLDEFTSIWFKKEGFEHIFCGEPEIDKLGGFHFFPRYAEAQKKKWAKLNPDGNNCRDEKIFTISVDYKLPKQINSNTYITDPRKGYHLDMNAIDIFIAVTKAFEEHRIKGKDGYGPIFYIPGSVGEYKKHKAKMWINEDSISTYYPMVEKNKCLSEPTSYNTFFKNNINSSNINAATFNIKWLGYSKERDNEGIAKMFSDTNRELVLIQELVAPPVPITVSSTKTIKADPEVTKFFNAMEQQGYSYILSEEDTGTGDKIHKNSSATEWFVAFYKKDKLALVDNGFIANDRSNHDDYERVPYYFMFKTNNGIDFVVVSTHLKPGKLKKDRKRRYHELSSILSWVKYSTSQTSERDYIILGDMNIYDCNTLDSNLNYGFVRANTECLNSNLKMTEPYDQVLYIPEYTSISNYEVVDMYKRFNVSNSIPNKEMIAEYSDHHPVFFEILQEDDND